MQNKSIKKKKLITSHKFLSEKYKQQTEALKESNAHFQLSFEIANIAICLVNLEGRFTMVNNQMCKMYGYSKKELEAMNIKDITHPDDLGVSPKFIQQAKSGRVDHQRFVKRYIHKDGHIVWGEVSSTIVRNDQGNPLFFISYVQDITERKKAEEDTARQAKLLNLIFQNSLDSIVLLDKDYNFIWVSDTYAKSCQRDLSEFAGHNHFEFYPSNLKEEFDAAKKGKSIYRKYARPFIFPDHPEWGETYWDLGLVPIFDDDGEIEMFLFTLKDVTDRKRTQIKLEESERKYRELVEDINDAIYSVDTKGNVVYISPAIKSLVGYEPHELIGKHFSDLVHSEDLKEMKKGFESSLAGKTVPADYRILNKAGSYTWVRALSKTIKDNKNNVIGIRGVVSDINERKHTEEALRLSENQLLKAQHIARMGFLTWNLKTNEMHWSDEVYRLYGIEKDKQEITLDFTVSLVHPEDLEYVQKNLELAVKEVAKYDINHRVIRPDGKVFWVHAMAELSRDKDGNPESLLGTVIDITKYKEAEEAIKKSQDSLRFFAGKLITAQEEERRRLAREMHDDLTQRLALLAIEAGKLEIESQKYDSPMHANLQDMKKKIIKLSKDIHDISRQIHPSILDDLGLVNAIKSECAAFTQREGIHVEYEVNNVPSSIPRNVKICIYRIIQEGLRNIAKHAGTDKAYVSLTCSDGNLFLTVKDNGVGFDTLQMQGQKGIGLTSIEERIRLIQGEFSVQSESGEGTVIKVAVPCVEEQE